MAGRKNISSHQNGYSLPIAGLNNGKFYQIHVPALVCIFLSMISVITVLIFSFKKRSARTFFKWTKSERFVVYIAICDGLFNVFHAVDHLHITINRNHVYPEPLCQFYALMLVEFITAQNLLVNVVTINAYILIYFRINVNFGRYDYRLLLYIFGVPLLSGLIALAFGVLGPNGAFCFFDGKTGEIANLVMITVPSCIILVVNITLYILTWLRIREEEPKFKDQAGNTAKVVRASHRAVKTMSLFVAAFLIQWWALAVHGIVQISVKNIPFILFQFVTTFSNIGGILNGIVYIVVRRRTNDNGRELSSSDFVRPGKNNTLNFKRINNTDISPVASEKLKGYNVNRESTISAV